MAAAWMRDVFSTMVKQVGYSEDPPGLVVVWKNGKTSLYEGVQEGLCEELATTASVGQMINSEIKGSYNHRYI